jgi:hypothetical protein
LRGITIIISHKYKFIFIKTGRTAGTSIEVFLSQCCGDADILTPIKPPVEPHMPRNYTGLWNPIPEILLYERWHARIVLRELYRRQKFYNHIPAQAVRARVRPGVWNNYFKFTVERNPWDKTLSHYHMRKHLCGGSLSLDEYFRVGKFCFNFPLYTDHSGNLLVDRVVRYEALAGELGEVFSMLGIPFTGSLGVNAKSEYRDDQRHYREVLSEAQKKRVEADFKLEISMHDYRY